MTISVPLLNNSRIMLSAGTLQKAGFRERVEAASAAGFDAISLFPQQYLKACRKEKLSAANMREILDDHKLALDEVDPLLDWFGPAASKSERLMFDYAAALGARSVNVAPAFAPNIELDELISLFANLCDRANAYGLRADLEFLPWTMVPDLRTALDVVKATGKSNAGITLDCWHFFRSGSDPSGIADLDAGDIALITNLQICDSPKIPAILNARHKKTAQKEMLINAVDGIRTMGFSAFLKAVSRAHYPHPQAGEMMNEALFSRLLPGEGDIPLAKLLSNLHSAGCSPAIGLEIFSLDFFEKTSVDIARQAMAAFQKTASQVH